MGLLDKLFASRDARRTERIIRQAEASVRPHAP
jgi:hypothetical protein